MLSNDIKNLIEGISSVFPDLGGAVTDAGQARAMVAAMTRAGRTEIPVGSVVDERVPPGADTPDGVPVRIYHPMGSAGDEAPSAVGSRPLVVFLHGGGWVLGDLSSSDATCRRLARSLDVVVVSVDYRLAPEHRFPAAVHDAVAVLEWAAQQAASLGADPDRLVVAGDSAGANLAAAAALVARDRGGPAVALQLLLYPVLDARCDSDSYRDNATGYFLTAAHMRWFWDQYLNDPADGDDPRASPLRADDLAGVAPALVFTAGYDPLRDEGSAYAARLIEAGVAADHVCFDGLFHGFMGFVDVVDEAASAYNQVVTGIRRSLFDSEVTA